MDSLFRKLIDLFFAAEKEAKKPAAWKLLKITT